MAGRLEARFGQDSKDGLQSIKVLMEERFRKDRLNFVPKCMSLPPQIQPPSIALRIRDSGITEI